MTKNVHSLSAAEEVASASRLPLLEGRDMKYAVGLLPDPERAGSERADTLPPSRG